MDWGRRLMFAISTGIDAFKDGPKPAEWDVEQERYMEKWSRYDGSLFEGMADANQWGANQPAIYANTKLLWKHIEAVVDFYAGVIYQGALSDQPEEGAIPWKLNVDGDVWDKAGLLADTPAGRLWGAIGALYDGWNWQQQMSLRPMYAAALGDCLTELVDDTERRFVYPLVVWPGYVKEIEIDYVGNVRAYTLEYMVQERDDKGGIKETYKYTKTVGPYYFRYYKNDKPFGYDGRPAVIENPYGFVPAVWDRHRIAAPGAVRGKSATDGTRQALYQLNSLFGHSFDFQHKAFEVPPMLASSVKPRAEETPAALGAPPSAGRELAERYRMRYVPADASLLQPTFDVGKTLEMIKELREGILAENPEASFYQQMREMQQVTAPGAERLMGDVKNRVDLARAGYDSGTRKLFQMGITMCGFRARDTSEFGWARRGAPPLDRRRMAFIRFDLQSFDRGELDADPMTRPIVLPTEQERMETELLKVQLIAAKEALSTPWGLEEAGLEAVEANAILAAQRERESLFAYDDVPTPPVTT